MEKTGQNGDMKGTAPEQDLEIAQEAGDPSEEFNGEIQQISEHTSSAVEKDLTGSEQDLDDLLTEEDLSQQETTRTSDLEGDVSDESKAEDQINGKVSEEEEEEESERENLVVQNLEVKQEVGEVIEVKQEIGEVIEVVEEIEIIEERQAPVEETQKQEDIKDDTEPKEAVVEKRKIKYVEEDLGDLDFSDGPDSQGQETEEEGSVAEFANVEEKENTETIVEDSEEEEEEEDEEEEEEEAEDQHTVQQRLQSQQDLVDGDHKTKESIQSVQRTYTKEPTKEKDKDSKEKDKDSNEENKPEIQRLTVTEPVQRRKSSTENFLKLKNRFSSEIIDENNKKNVEGEKKRNKEKENERARGASNMSDAKKRFGGTSEKCTQCNRTVYPMEKMEVAGRLLHKTCFKCCKCNSQLSVGRFSIGGKDMYCMTHYKQAFREKGTYDVFTPDNPIKGKWENK